MASIHGTSTVVSLDNSAGAPVDLTAQIEDISPEMMQTLHDITTFGASALARTPGLKDGKAAITFLSNQTVIDHLTGLYGAQTPGSSTTWTLTIGPRGSTSGFEKFSIEVLLSALPLPTKVSDVEKITAQFEGSGGWTIGVY
jgi:hypothetical protein